jgi:general stress protein CsbA
MFDINTLDYAFPTIVRYVGLVTTLVLIGFSIAGYYIETAPGFVASAGMILYKTVNNAAQDRSGES